MERKGYALQLIETIVGDKPTAQMVLDRLQEEGLLHLGYGDNGVDTIVGTFSELFGATKLSQRDRYAATRLARSEHYGGSQGVVGLMKLYHSLLGDKYAPTVSSVAEFEEKLPKIVMFMRKQGQQREEIQL